MDFDGKSLTSSKGTITLEQLIYKSPLPEEFYKEIFRGRLEGSEEPLAITIVHKLTPKGSEVGHHEMDCLQKFQRIPQVIETYEIMESDTYIVWVQKLYASSVYSLINKRPLLDEEKTVIFKNILKAVQEIHQLGYVYVDTSSENFLIDQKVTTAKLTDFGSAKKQETLSRPHRTLVYSSFAPELIQNRYSGLPIRETVQSDVWGLGNAFYFIHNRQHTPWHSLLIQRKKKEAYEIMSDEKSFPKPKDRQSIDYLVWSMLRPLPNERLTIEKVLGVIPLIMP